MDFESTIRRSNLDDTANANYWDTVKRSGHSYPEQDLMLAVLKDALLTYRKHLRNPTKSLRRDREWFFANDHDGLFSFESVCAVLGLDPQRIRKRLAPLRIGKPNPTEPGSAVKLRRLVYFVAGGDWSSVASFRTSSGFKSDTAQ